MFIKSNNGTPVTQKLLSRFNLKSRSLERTGT